MTDPKILALAAVLGGWADTVIKPQQAPAKPRYTKLADLSFDWETLRLMVNVKLANRPRKPTDKHNDMGYKELARELGLSDHTVGAFCRGQKDAVTVDTAMRFMAWLGYTDFASFIKGETEEDDNL